MLDLFKQPIHWYKPTEIQLPSEVATWLLEEQSLTKRLQQFSASNVEVELYGQSLLPHSYDFLQANAAPIWSRQVQLFNQQGPLIEAHSLMLQQNIDNELADLASLGTRPLGEVIFTQPDLRRESIEIAQLDGLWLRQSRLRLRGCPIVVAELFYPVLFLS